MKLSTILIVLSAGTLLLALVAQGSAGKSSYRSPLVPSRVAGGSGHMVGGMLAPSRSSSRPILSPKAMANLKQIIGHKPGAAPSSAAPALPGKASLLGAKPAPKVSAGAIARSPLKPLLIPRPSAARPPPHLNSSISSIYGSTQVDNRGGCTSFGANESSVAQSSVNPNNVVVVFQMYRNPNGTCGDSHDFIGYSHDGGQHWLQTNPSTLLHPVSGDAVVTYDAKHNVFVHGFLEFNRSNAAAGRIAAEVSADGASWSRDVTLDSSSATIGVDKPMITADNNPASPHYGRVAISWTQFRSVGDQIFQAAYTDDAGLTWHFGASSINFTGECGNGTSPAFDASGGLMVAWWDCTGGTAKLREEYSPDGGATWPGTDNLIINIDSIENPSTGACFLDGGGSAFRCNSFPSLAGSPNIGGVGTHAFAVVWSDVDSITQSGVTHNVAEIHEISTVNPTPTSATWDFHNFGSFANFGDKFFPWASFSVTDGRFNIAYHSRENDASTGNPQGLRFNQRETEAGSLCRLRGGCGGDQFITYTTDGTLSNPGSSAFIGDYDGSSSYDRNFDSYASYVDIRSGTNDIRSVQLCYINCYGFLSPYVPVFRGFAPGATFTDFWQINTDPSFGGSGNNFWNAVGIRIGSDGTANDDDMFVAPNRYFDTSLAGSSFSPPFNDYVVINNNSGHAPAAPYFPQVHSFSTIGGPYTVEWAAGHLILGTAFSDSMGSSDTVDVFDTFLNTGTTYFFGLRPAGGNTSIYTFALHSASNGNAQGAPSAAAAVRRNPAGQPAFLSFNTGAQPSQWDGLVVGNDNSGSGSYTLYRDTASPSGTVSINGGAAWTTGPNVNLALAASNPTAGDPVFDMRISTDGAMDTEAWQPFAASVGVTLPSGDGTKTVLVQYRNGAGATSAVVSDTIGLDTTDPASTAPNPKWGVGLAISLGVPTGQVAWTPTDATSGVCTNELFVSVNGGAFSPVSLPTPATHQINQPFVVGNTYRYETRITDCAGNVSAFKLGRKFRSNVIQEHTSAWTYSSGWTNVNDPNASGGSIKQSSTAGNNAALSFTGFAVGLISRKDSASGTANASVDGGAVTAVNMNAASTVEKKILYVKNALVNGAHTFNLVNLGTAGHPKINVDAAVVLIAA